MSVQFSLFSILKSHNDWIEIVTLVVTSLIFVTAVIALLVARKSLRETKRVKTYQVLTDFVSNYRSAEMLLAVQTLWGFYEEVITKRLKYTEKGKLSKCETSKIETTLWREYNKIRKQDDCEIKWLKPEGRLARNETTLHHYRRMVGGFYELLAGIYREKVIDDKTIFTYWNKETLAIIPKILLPIEKQLFKDLHKGTNEYPEIYILMEDLYDDHPGGRIDWFWKHKFKRWFHKKIRWIQKYCHWIISLVKKNRKTNGSP